MFSIKKKYGERSTEYSLGEAEYNEIQSRAGDSHTSEPQGEVECFAGVSRLSRNKIV